MKCVLCGKDLPADRKVCDECHLTHTQRTINAALKLKNPPGGYYPSQQDIDEIKRRELEKDLPEVYEK